MYTTKRFNGNYNEIPTEDNEIWIPLRNYEYKYMISNLGRIFSFRGINGKILKPIKYKLGYYYQILTNNNIQKQYLLSRLVAIHFVPNPNNLNEVNHKDCDKSNNKASNLEWCTHLYNMQHARKNVKFKYKIIVKYKKNYDLNNKNGHRGMKYKNK